MDDPGRANQPSDQYDWDKPDRPTLSPAPSPRAGPGW